MTHSTTFNLQYGPYTHVEPADGDTIALHLDVRHGSGTVVRNNFEAGGWGEEESSDFPDLQSGETFLIDVKVTAESFGLQINGANIGNFEHRVPFENITNLFIFHDVVVNSVSSNDQKLDAIN